MYEIKEELGKFGRRTENKTLIPTKRILADVEWTARSALCTRAVFLVMVSSWLSAKNVVQSTLLKGGGSRTDAQRPSI